MNISRIKNLFKIILDLSKRYKLRSFSAFFQYIRFRNKFEAGYDQFISLNYLDMSKEQKESLLFMPEYYGWCFRVNPYSQLKILRDKRTVIERMPQYLGRECRIEEFKDKDGFIEFGKRHGSFYAKKNFNAASQGTRVFRNLTGEKDIEEAYDLCKDEGLTIIEAFIEQHPILSNIYPDVVNTIRIHTMRGRDGIKIVLMPELYVASGGEKNTVHTKKDRYTIFIDLESGRLWKKAYRDIRSSGLKTYGETCHCDTGAIFSDITIPYWDEVKEMVVDAASYITELAYIGWDVGITPSGPVIIEGNAISGVLLSYQVNMSMINGGYGVRGEFEEMFALVD